MNDDKVSEIIDQCIAINKKASEIYGRLAGGEDIEELRRFWEEMNHEEKNHAAFWKNIKKIGKRYGLPSVFNDPAAIRNDLEQLLQKVEILLSRWEADQTMENALILAYRLEYHMLHPAFEKLFQILKPLSGETGPEDTYDLHINRFIGIFARYGKITPALELLGETLQSLWQRNKILTELVMIDGQTGLLNRRGFLMLAGELSYLAKRNKENIGILMIDIDRFKEINDRHGHPKGDVVLREVAESLKTSVRKSDIVGRFGGDEFIVMFPAILPSFFQRTAETIRLGVEKIRPAGIPVTISVGGAQSVILADSDAELFNWIVKADQRLYQAKSNGRNCIVSGP